MVKYTPNYNLGKPEGADMYSVLPHNNNMDILDSILGGIGSDSTQAVITSTTALEKATESHQLISEHLEGNTWNEVTLLNGWQPFDVGYEPKFTINKHNVLIVKGAIKNGVTNKGIPLFDLGIAMERYRIFNAVNNNQNGTSYLYTPVEIAIDPSGKVSLGSNIPYTNFLSLDEIHIQM